jgi:hypothetical protein
MDLVQQAHTAQGMAWSGNDLQSSAAQIQHLTVGQHSGDLGDVDAQEKLPLSRRGGHLVELTETLPLFRSLCRGKTLLQHRLVSGVDEALLKHGCAARVVKVAMGEHSNHRLSGEGGHCLPQTGKSVPAVDEGSPFGSLHQVEVGVKGVLQTPGVFVQLQNRVVLAHYPFTLPATMPSMTYFWPAR